MKGYLLREGTDARYGARHLKRVVERSLVDPLCNLMATGQVRSCDEIRVDLDKQGQMMFYLDKEKRRTARHSRDHVRRHDGGSSLRADY